MVCHRAGYETGALDLEERSNSENLKLVYLFHWPTCFSGKLNQWVPREGVLDWVLGL